MGVALAPVELLELPSVLRELPRPPDEAAAA
jgi:hypothetical protein